MEQVTAFDRYWARSGELLTFSITRHAYMGQNKSIKQLHEISMTI
jgi:hypothetical protein